MSVMAGMPDILPGDLEHTPEERRERANLRGSPEPLSGRCCARVKHSDPPRYCTQRPIRGRTRCRMHGGATPAGPTSPHWRTGRYSKFMPTGLLQRAIELAEDPDVLSLVPNLVAVDAQLATVYEQLAEPARAEAWGKVHGLVGRMEEALRQNDTTAMTVAFLELRAVNRIGASTLDLGEQLRRFHETRRRLVDTEAKRLTNEHAAVSYDRAMGVVLLLVDVMFRHVPDRETRGRIIDDVRAIVAAADVLS